ncbi:hypothetical protein GOP47_0013578 [Adiantum capillus-veneris]|uniref:NADH-ubiquinone oxidoreductase subunit B14.7 n=1 Tax=Adiantum capillus-veneris TaxID=13818 RepID=A0A9D4UPA9_ADICA|nr:hypothetical protein GOP47_0013578 [Adiantum capillus-veneris]
MDPGDRRDEYDSIFFRTVERNVALPGLKKTLRVMGDYGLTYAAVAGVFAFTDASAEKIRGKKDMWNSVIGGLAAGSVMGIRARNLRVGLAASGACAAVAAIVDVSGQTTRTPIGREYLPYPTRSSSTD